MGVVRHEDRGTCGLREKRVEKTIRGIWSHRILRVEVLEALEDLMRVYPDEGLLKTTEALQKAGNRAAGDVPKK